MTYRRGFNRAYLVLCGLWILAAVFVAPWYWKHSLLDQATFWSLQSITEADQHGNAHTLATEYSRQNSELTYASYWRDVLLTPWAIGALIGVPMAIYALLYSVIAVAAWVVRGFSANR